MPSHLERQVTTSEPVPYRYTAICWDDNCPESLDTYGNHESILEVAREHVAKHGHAIKVDVKSTIEIRPGLLKSTVLALDVSARFLHDGEAWRVSATGGSYIEARSEQFSVPRVFYDPVTAAKTGELSWDTIVEVLP